MNRQRGGVGGLLLGMILGVLLVGFLVYRFYLGRGPGHGAMVDVDGVSVQRSIQSVDQARKLIQNTKSTLDVQTKNMEQKINEQMKKIP